MPRGAGEVVDALDRRVAEAALRHVDDALEFQVVGGIVRDLQIGDRVLDLLALVEARAADDAIGQAQRDEAVLEHAHLERGAHQDRDLVQRDGRASRSASISSPIVRASSSSSHTPSDRDLVAELAVGEQRLAEAALVVRDQAGGGAEDVAGGAVVALEPDDGGAGEILLEAQDVVDLGAAPAVDRLVVVADAAEVRRALREQPQPQVLHDVGVLVLVDQDVAEAALVVGEHVGMLAEEAQRFEQQVAEVDGVELLQALLVGGIELRAHAVGEGAALARAAPCPASAPCSSSRR